MSLSQPNFTPHVPYIPQVQLIKPNIRFGPSSNLGSTITSFGQTIKVTMKVTKAIDVLVLDNFLSREECEMIRSKSIDRLSKSFTVDPQSGGQQDHPHRLSEGTFIHNVESPEIYKINQRIEQVCNWPLDKGEALQILRYIKGGEYRPHLDYFPPYQPGSARLIERSGQRVGTLICYLNDVEAGGATIFPNLGLEVTPALGRAVFFNYTDYTDYLSSLHGGTPVITGEKWIATKWMRQQNFVG